MEECTDEEVQRLLPLVSTQRREQALRYKHIFGQFCCLKSWMMLAESLQNKGLGLEDWCYNEHGKPFWPNGPYFSISHCKHGIAVAIDEHPIGIDIEAIRHADDDLLARTMNEFEQSKIKNQKSKNAILSLPVLRAIRHQRFPHVGIHLVPIAAGPHLLPRHLSMVGRKVHQVS